MSDTSVPTSRFSTTLTTFANAIGVDPAKVTEKVLATAVNDQSDASLLILGDASSVPDSDWSSMFPTSEFPTAKPPVLRAAVKALREAVAPAPAAPAPGGIFPVVGAGVVPTTNTLKRLGDDAAFLQALVSGGVLNGSITPMDGVAAVRVYFANRNGLYQLRRKLVEQIDAAAENGDTPADASAVYELMNDIAAEDNATLLRAMKVPSKAVSPEERKKFLARLDTVFIPGVLRFYDSLAAWYEGFTAVQNNPANLVAAISGRLSGVVEAPVDVSPLRSAAAALANVMNSTFKGLNHLAVARIMAKDAMDVTSIVKDLKYMVAAGYRTPEEMRRGLGITITDVEVRASVDMAEFVLNALDIPNIPDSALADTAQRLYLHGAQAITSLRGSAPGTTRREDPWGAMPGDSKPRRHV